MSRTALTSLLSGLLLMLALAGTVTADAAPPRTAVDDQRLKQADAESSSWLMDGRNYQAQRYSPLAKINEHNVQQLGLAWFQDLDTYRGVEGTPLMVDGVLYNTSAWNITSAYDARTGKPLWTFDPQVPRQWGR